MGLIRACDQERCRGAGRINRASTTAGLFEQTLSTGDLGIIGHPPTYPLGGSLEARALSGIPR